jgi:hypothetical protein
MSHGTADDVQIRERLGTSLKGLAERDAFPRWWLPAAAVALVWMSWPIASLTPEAGLDGSWQIALSLAARHRLSFGRDLVFTYGPLGFLAHPRLVTFPTALAAIAFAAATQFALCLLLLRRTLRTYPWYVALLLTYSVVAMLAASGFSNLGDYSLFFVLFFVVAALQGEQRPPIWLLPLVTLLATCELLIKVSDGLIAFVLLSLAAWRTRPGGWRSEAILAASGVTSLALVWVGTGGRLADLPRWLYESLHIVKAYTPAMAIEATSTGVYLQAVIFILVAAVLVIVTFRHLERSRSLPLAAALAIYTFAYFKEGFVRLDPIHASLFFAAFATAVLTITWTAQTRWVAATLVLGLLGAVATITSNTSFFYRPSVRMAEAMNQLESLAHSDREITAARRDIRESIKLDPRTVQLLRGHTVDVQPYETSAVWGYGLTWRPEPLLQSYVALDHELDRFNAKFIEKHGADRVLVQRESPALDGRNALYLAPESYLVLLCSYRQLHAYRDWTTLGRATNRCGSARRLSSLQASQGQSVRVPAAPSPSDVVVARMQIPTTLKQRLADFIFKRPYAPGINLDAEQYRLVTAVARGPLVLRVPKSSGFSPALGGGLSYDRLSVLNVASPVRIEFFALHLREGA